MPQTNEWLLYRASGQLPRGFQGHISYTTLLPGELRALRVVFTFDKREPQQEPDTLRAGCMAAAAQNLPEGTPVPEALAEHLCTMPKGEINVSLFLNGACVGSAHRNQLTKEMLLAPQGSSEGFVNCRPTGVLRVVLHVLNVLNDETNYTLRLEEVAARVFISKTYLSELFTSYTGMSFTTYVTRQRMQRAKKLLLSTRMSIHDVGQACGFYSSAYFSTVFTRQFGLSPSRYRTAMAQLPTDDRRDYA